MRSTHSVRSSDAWPSLLRVGIEQNWAKYSEKFELFKKEFVARWACYVPFTVQFTISTRLREVSIMQMYDEHRFCCELEWIFSAYFLFPTAKLDILWLCSRLFSAIFRYLVLRVIDSKLRTSLFVNLSLEISMNLIILFFLHTNLEMEPASDGWQDELETYFRSVECLTGKSLKRIKLDRIRNNLPFDEPFMKYFLGLTNLR